MEYLMIALFLYKKKWIPRTQFIKVFNFFKTTHWYIFKRGLNKNFYGLNILSEFQIFCSEKSTYILDFYGPDFITCA